jgi:MipA family protein
MPTISFFNDCQTVVGDGLRVVSVSQREYQMLKFVSAAAGVGIVMLVGSVQPVMAADESSASASAGNGDSFRIGIGAGTAPDYEGSDDYGFFPFPFFDMSYQGFGLRSNRLGVEADVFPMDALAAGPIVRYDMGRDDDVKDSFVKQLPEVDGSVEVGGFVGTGLPLRFIGMDSDAIITARLEFVQGLNGGHEGATATGSLGLVAPLSSDLTLITSVSTTYMSSDYADAYFSISGPASSASGLAAYEADAGFKDVSVSAIVDYGITENVSLTAIGSYSRLIGDAADSPIVKDRGDENQFFGGIGLSYTF